ncbi:hypothetical protein M0208_05670 [Sphingomonas sp. SUN019]|uniref:hypothetical protein n=1 Tax=Sphingomonas sp. SUN019 TaxID=2937788 RepID=UPI0021640DDA|nr:hypothetical protein [Sphingomonas sp. SUN019]UVO50032.1 hypothetical protein M0208_05670 [Sphingomonas sp. SUN019]
MSIEAIAASAAGMGAGAMPPPETIQAGPGASIADITSFQSSMTAGGANGIGGSDALPPAIKAMFTQLEKVNGEAKGVAEYANAASAKGADMTPGEVVNLTMKCHEFMFHCQLTSNIANRTSDGIQQLFRQQS